MNITVFGSTGKTGLLLLKDALEQGHKVQAFARNPEKIGFDHPNLRITQGDALHSDDVVSAIEGCDAVISLLGVNPKAQPLTFYRSMQNVIEGMKKHGVKPLVMSAGAGVGDEHDGKTFVGSLMGGLIRLIAKSAWEDGVKTAGLIRSANDIDWTMVRIPMLTDEPAGKKPVRYGYLGKGTAPKLSRGDLSQAMLRELEQSEYVRRAPVVSN